MRWETEWSFVGKLCQKYSYQKLSKFDNWFQTYSQKCWGCFLRHSVVVVVVVVIVSDCSSSCHSHSRAHSRSSTTRFPNKKVAKLFLSELCQISTTFDNFWHMDSQDDRYVRYTHCPPDIIYVNALPCKTKVLQIVA